MIWLRRHLLLLLLLTGQYTLATSGYFSKSRLDELRAESISMFDHGWDNYFDIAFPDDELRPLSCIGVTRNDSDPNDLVLNDVLGGYSLTLIDSLDMFAIMNRTEDFHRYIDYTINYVSFNVSSTVQVFETTIRALGGLLSSHLYASLPRLGQTKPGYDGELLHLAYDLGQRLLPAFGTATGIPHPRVNLRDGIVPIGDSYITETCSSGAGSLLLEFAMLSRLTGDKRFEDAARKAFFEVWTRRSDLDLVAMSLDSQMGYWKSPITGNGASIDSLYEYAVKYYVLFGDDQFYSIFDRMHQSLKSYAFDGWVYNNINFQTGVAMTSWIDSLAAFFPGLQILAGNVEDAIRNHLAYYKLWITYAGIPERWNVVRASRANFDLVAQKAPSKVSQVDPIDLEWYPLRPEFVESNYYIYRATQDPFYLQVGKGIMNDLQKFYKTKCGYAGIHDVRNGVQQDRMETFFLSETVKYLYLLFTPGHPLNSEFSNFVFSTEAHPMWYDSYVLKHASVSRFPQVEKQVEKGLQTATQKTEEAGAQKQGPEPSSLNLVSKLWSAWESRISNNKPVIVNQPRYRKNTNKKKDVKVPITTHKHKCRAWNMKKGLLSLVASWDQFYTLDSMYQYQSPEWLTDKNGGDRTSLELDPEFYNTYVFGWSQCRAVRTDSILEVVFSVGDDELPGEVNFDGDIIRATRFSGSKLKLGRVDQKLNAFKVLLIDNKSVGEKLVHVDELIVDNDNENSLVKVSENGTMMIEGEEVVNVKIDKH